MPRADNVAYDLGGGVAAPSQQVALTATGAAVPIRGGTYMFAADGTISSATVSLQFQLPDATWCDIGALAGNAIVKSTTLPLIVTPVVLPAGNVRLAVAGGTTPSVFASLVGAG